jgi:hypothetical protein
LAFRESTRAGLLLATTCSFGAFALLYSRPVVTHQSPTTLSVALRPYSQGQRSLPTSFKRLSLISRSVLLQMSSLDKLAIRGMYVASFRLQFAPYNSTDSSRSRAAAPLTTRSSVSCSSIPRSPSLSDTTEVERRCAASVAHQTPFRADSGRVSSRPSSNASNTLRLATYRPTRREAPLYTTPRYVESLPRSS